MKQRVSEYTIILFIASLLALNYPLLSSVNHLVLILGIPLLYLYIFLIWSAIIVFMALISERAARHSDDRTDS